MEKLTWDQVTTWRLQQHAISSHLDRDHFLEAMSRLGGIQAQVLSAAELGVSSRAEGVTREDIRHAMQHDYSVVKTWAMRGTLHLLSIDTLPLLTAAHHIYSYYNWEHYFAYFGISQKQHQAFISSIRNVLGTTPMTRQQLAQAVAKDTHIPKFERFIMESSWGGPLKESAFLGDLAFGPQQGQNITFINPKHLIKNWKEIDPQEALEEVLRLYLRTYGPATPKDFTRWWWGGSGLSIAKKLFQSLSDELEEVDIEGKQAYALHSSIKQIQNSEMQHSVHLLPMFDAYTFETGNNIGPLLSQKHKTEVFRPQGWISATVVINGYIKGTWKHTMTGKSHDIAIHMFVTPQKDEKEKIRHEAERIGTFLGTQFNVTYN